MERRPGRRRGSLTYSNDTFLLGAGFSKAVHSAMPTLAGLGDALRDRLLADGSVVLPARVRDQLNAGKVPLGNLEMWLSSLSERLPFVSRSAAARNEGLYEDVAQLLVGVVEQAQAGFWADAPAWLHFLIRLWHRRRATVVTFNYDTIVEGAMQGLDAPGADGDIVAAILTQLPRRAVTALGGDLAESFQLIKLHGSLDWYWNPDDPSGESLCRMAPGTSEADARSAVAGKVPFIVPPLAAKGRFYSLGLVRQLWQEAATGLARADRIMVVGYSVPLTDLATVAMLGQAANPEAEWHVVNPDGGAADRLIQLGVREEAIRHHAAVKEWADWYQDSHCAEISADLAGQLDAFRSADSRLAPIMVRRSRWDYLIIVGIESDHEHVLLHAHERQQGEVIEENYPREPDLAACLAQLRQPSRVGVVIEGVDGEHDVLGALDPVSVRGSHAVLHWCPLEIQDLPRQR